MKRAAILLLAVALLAAGILLELTREPQFVMVAQREYDADGKLTYEQTYDENGNVLTDGSTKYVYERGRLVRKEEYSASADDPLAMLRRLFEYEYDLFGRLDTERRYYEMGTVYDENSGLVGIEPILTYILSYKYLGNTVTTLCYEPDGVTLKERTVETYDSEGRKTALYDYYPPDKLYSVRRWEYGEDFTNDEEHRWDSREEQFELSHRERHTYDEQGRELLTEYYDGLMADYSIEFRYDISGNLVEKVHRDNKKTVWRVEKFTNEHGRVIEHRSTYIKAQAWKEGVVCISFAEDPRKTYGRGHDYTYDEDGNLATMTVINQYGFPESTTTYTYDDHGNCIREEFVSESDGDSKIIEREFVRSRAPAQP